MLPMVVTLGAPPAAMAAIRAELARLSVVDTTAWPQCPPMTWVS